MGRSYDFSETKKERVKAAFSHTCAACGSDDPMMLSVDHWIAANKTDSGVCLCLYCNTIKGAAKIPESLRLNPRGKLKALLRDEYALQMAANREAWGVWVGIFRGKNRVKPIAFAIVTFISTPK